MNFLETWRGAALATMSTKAVSCPPNAQRPCVRDGITIIDATVNVE